MARYNEIQVGRFNRLIQKLLSLKGGASLVSAEDSLGFVLSLFHGAENRYLESWERFGNNTDQAGVAGVQSIVQIRNPTGSNIVVVLEKVLVTSTGGGADVFHVQFGPQTADLATVNTVVGRLDRRGRGTPVAIVSSASTIVGAGSFGVFILRFGLSAADQAFDLILDVNQEITILPGDGFGVLHDSTGIQISVSFIWRERQLEESERA